MSRNRDVDNPAERCRILSSRVERLLAAIVTIELLLIALSAQNLARKSELSVGGPAGILAIMWIVWLFLLFNNFRLVSCGHQGIRYRHAPRLINRSDLPVRLAMHFLINWSVILTTIVYAWSVDDIGFSHNVGWFLQGTIVAVWISFNRLHRRMNRGRNVILSTAIAVALVSVVWITLIGEF